MPSLTSCDVGLRWLYPHFIEGKLKPNVTQRVQGWGSPVGRPTRPGIPPLQLLAAGAFLPRGNGGIPHRQRPLVVVKCLHRLQHQVGYLCKSESTFIEFVLGGGGGWGR